MTHKKILLLGALALVAFAAGCGSDECSVDTDCASKGTTFVCTNNTCVQKTPIDAGTTCAPACSGATPICNQSTLTCVACTQDSECGGETPSCDVATNTCVACSDNTDCQDSADGPACDTSTHTCVACTMNTDCGGATPTCDTTAHTCVACVSNGDCTDASAPVCDSTSHTCGCSENQDCADSTAGQVCDTANNVCVACLDNTQCSGTTPVCDTANHTCTAGCGSDTDCDATPATPVCNTATSVCVACLDSNDCSGTTPVCDATTHTCGCTAEADCAGATGTPTCDTSTNACVAACTVQTDCTISQDCTDGGQGLLCAPVDVAAASTAIDAIKTAAIAGTTDSTQAVTGAIVTYLKPAVGSEAAAFFVQAEATGPALYVAVDPGTLSPSPVVGDRVSFTATTLAYVNKQAQVTALSGLTVMTSGHDASALLTDVSSATDLVTALDSYESRLVGMGFTISADPANANSGYMSALVTTTGMPTGSSSLKFYAPSTIFSGLDLTNGCTAQITNGVMFRYNNTAEPAVWGTSDLTVNTCPQPKLLSAVRPSATEVDLTFDRNIDPLTITAGAFTITETNTPANTLTVTAATFDPNDSRKVILTTAAQSGGVDYTVTVGSTLKDDLGTGQSVDPAANTATFVGFVTPAQVVINEFNANIGSGCDLIELRVMSGGSMGGFHVQERDSGSLYTFPAGFMVATDDLLIVHMGGGSGTCNPNGELSESSAKNQFPAATHAGNYDTAWDLWSTDAGLTATDNVFTVYDAGGGIMDAVLAANGTTGTAAAGSEAQAADVAAANQWEMVGGGIPTGGFVDDNFRAWAVQGLAATGTDATGDSLQRNTNTDSNDMNGWAQTAQTWGALNAGQTAL